MRREHEEPARAETTIGENETSRLKAYRRPSVRPLGNLQELTRGGPGSFIDGVNTSKKKP